MPKLAKARRLKSAILSRPIYVESTTFQDGRVIAGWDRLLAAQRLGVTLQTIRNWEAGRVLVPYSAFKLMRIFSGYELPGDHWRGFSIRGEFLWSPEGRSFSACDLAWWSLTCSMARSFRLDRQWRRFQGRVDGAGPSSVSVPVLPAGGPPAGGTAPQGTADVPVALDLKERTS